MGRGITAVLTCLALAAGTIGSPVAAEQGNPSPSWNELRFTAKKLFLESTTDVRLDVVDHESLAGVLREPTDGEAGLRPGASPVARMVVSSRFGSRHDESSLWFELVNSRALQRLKIRHGSKAYQKTYRFAAGGVHSHRVAPEEGEARLPPEHWSKIEDRFYPHGSEGCPVVIEPTALLHRLAEHPPAVGQSLELCAFSDKTTHRIVAENKGLHRVVVDYLTYLPGVEIPVRQQGETLLLRLEVRPAAEDDELELLGLEGAVEIWIDPGLRLPVRVVGKVGFLGKVAVKLESARLAASSPRPLAGNSPDTQPHPEPRVAASPGRR